MKQTYVPSSFMKRQGYNWYIYIGPADIHYFKTYEEAEKYIDSLIFLDNPAPPVLKPIELL